MIGVVLCGGNSTRMGTDKGLLKEAKETWVEKAAKKLFFLHLPVFISINRAQLKSYETLFEHSRLIIDNIDVAAKGPLLGMLSTHRQLPGEDVFVLACDMKDMTAELLQNLLAQSKKENSEACVYKTADKPQPLCGIYSAAGLKKIDALLKTGELMRFSMMHVLETLKSRVIPVDKEDFHAFANYNLPEEI